MTKEILDKIQSLAKNEAEILSLLENKDVDVHFEDRWSDCSLLTAAAASGKTLVVKRLLERGADPLKKDPEGHTALTRACYCVNPRVEILDALLAIPAVKAKINSYHRAIDGTVLALAVKEDCAANVACLMRHDADLNPGMEMAIQCANLDMAKLLKAAGATLDPNRVDKESMTPLRHAVKQNNEAFANWLLEHGADPRFRTEQYPSALACARRDRRHALVKILDAKPSSEPVAAYNQCRQLVQKAGAFLGLDGDIPFTHPESNEAANLAFQGGEPLDGAELMIELLNAYLPKLQNMDPAKNHFQKILAAFQAQRKFLAVESPDDFKSMLAQDLIILSGMLPDHIVGMAIVNRKHFIFCDRSLTIFPESLRLFQINPQAKLTEAYLKPLCSYETTWIDLIKNIAWQHDSGIPVMDFAKPYSTSKPYAAIPSKGAEHKFCFFLNLKSLVEGILYDLKLAELLQGKEIAKHFYKCDQIAKQYAYDEYKKMSFFMREYILALLFAILKDEKQLAPYRQLAETILVTAAIQHHGQEKIPDHPKVERRSDRSDKMAEELERVFQIFSNISATGQQAVLEKLGADFLKIATGHEALANLVKKIKAESKTVAQPQRLTWPLWKQLAKTEAKTATEFKDASEKKPAGSGKKFM